MKELKKNAGITLIALVISIIVMLILAGVSLNATIGENGIITKAQQAKLAHEDATIKEKLEMMITNYLAGDRSESFQTYLTSRQGNEIDKAFQIPSPDDPNKRIDAVQVGSKYYALIEDGNGSYRIEEINTDMSDIQGGITLATPENFEGGTMEFNPGSDGKSTLVFSDKIEAEYNFDIRSGEVTIYIDNDMTLTNEKVVPRRSAINIEPNAKLNLHIAEGVTLTVNSGFGEAGEVGSNKGAKGGPGGYAGIRVPWIDSNNNGNRDTGEQAELNLYGEGTVIAIGGDAGKGNIPSGVYGGRWRPDGAGAGIGGNGGKGGNANSTQTARLGIYSDKENDDNPATNTNTGWDGENGENCGIVKINNGVKVYAYGGAGGAGERGITLGAGGGGRLSCSTELVGGGAGRRTVLTTVMELVDIRDQEVNKIMLLDIMELVVEKIILIQKSN